MTLALENEIAAVLRAVRPRDGFSAELLAALTHDPERLHALGPVADRPRTRWIVAGAAVAGVVSATGAVYWGTRRRHHRGVA